MAIGDKLKFWKKNDTFSDDSMDLGGGDDFDSPGGLPPTGETSGVDDYFAKNDVSGDFAGMGQNAPSLNVGSPNAGMDQTGLGHDQTGLDHDQTGLPPSEFDQHQSTQSVPQGYTDTVAPGHQPMDPVRNTPFESATPGQAMAHQYMAQQQPVANTPTQQPQPQSAKMPLPQSLEMVHLKLDALRSEMVAVSQRLVKIEHVLDEQQKKKSW